MTYIDLDFLEIGTSDFGTLIECCMDHTVGISVEPIKEYLDKLPNKPNITKVCAAISIDDSTDDLDVYYIPADIIESSGLPNYLRGCNTIGKYHPLHIEFNVTHLVKIKKVKQIAISTLLASFNVRKIRYLKIDTEGSDCYILQNFLKYLQNKTDEYYPKIIKFESNNLSLKKLVDNTVNEFIKRNYEILEITKHDTVLIRSEK